MVTGRLANFMLNGLVFNLSSQWSKHTSSTVTLPIRCSTVYTVSAISNTSRFGWSIPTFHYSPSFSTTAITFTGVANGQEQANSWNNRTVTGYMICICK